MSAKKAVSAETTPTMKTKAGAGLKKCSNPDCPAYIGIRSGKCKHCGGVQEKAEPKTPKTKTKPTDGTPDTLTTAKAEIAQLQEELKSVEDKTARLETLKEIVKMLEK